MPALGNLASFLRVLLTQAQVSVTSSFWKVGGIGEENALQESEENILDQDTADAGITAPFYFRDMDVSRRCVVH